MKVKGTDDMNESSDEESEEFIDANHFREGREKEANARVDADQVFDIYDSQFEDVLDADFQELPPRRQ